MSTQRLQESIYILAFQQNKLACFHFSSKNLDQTQRKTCPHTVLYSTWNNTPCFWSHGHIICTRPWLKKLKGKIKKWIESCIHIISSALIICNHKKWWIRKVNLFLITFPLDIKEKKIYIFPYSPNTKKVMKKRGDEVDNEMTSDRSEARQCALRWWD